MIPELHEEQRDSGYISHVHRIYEETSEHSVKEYGLHKPNDDIPSALPLPMAG